MVDTQRMSLEIGGCGLFIMQGANKLAFSTHLLVDPAILSPLLFTHDAM